MTTLFVVLALFFGYRFYKGSVRQPDGGGVEQIISAVTYNTNLSFYGSQTDLSKTLQLIKGKDIVFLQRVLISQIQEILAEFPEYHWRFAATNDSLEITPDFEKVFSSLEDLNGQPEQVGLLSLSRFPIGFSANHVLRHMGVPHKKMEAMGHSVLETGIKIGGRSITFYNVLPCFEWEQTTLEHWVDEVQQVFDMATEADMPPVLVGDFHHGESSPAWSKIQRSEWVDLWTVVGEGASGTWNLDDGTQAEDRLDRIFVQPENQGLIEKMWVELNPAPGGNHNALNFEL